MRADLTDNPFAVLTAVVAPAILTNACSVLSLGTGNRIARVVDRTRALIAAKTEGADYSLYLNQLEMRGQLLMRALRLFYASLGAFAASALIAVAGSALAVFDLPLAFHTAAIIGFAIGSAGVVSLATGCVLMVRETRIALQTMSEEIEAGRR